MVEYSCRCKEAQELCRARDAVYDVVAHPRKHGPGLDHRGVVVQVDPSENQNFDRDVLSTG